MMDAPIRGAAVFDNNSSQDISTIEAQGSRSSTAGARTRNQNGERHSATAHVIAGRDISHMKMVKEEAIAKEDVVVKIAAIESANRKRRTTQPFSVVSYYAGKDVSQMKVVKEEDYAGNQSSTAQAPATLFELLGPATAPSAGKPFVMKAAALAATKRAATATSTAAKSAEPAPSPPAPVYLSKRAASKAHKQATSSGAKISPVASPLNAAGEFECEVCDQSFKDKFARAHHMISLHRDNRNQQKKGARGTQHKLNTAAYSRQFQCDVCPSRFSLNSSLLTHLRTEHSVPPYECKYCSQRFFYLAELTRHGTEEH